MTGKCINCGCQIYTEPKILKKGVWIDNSGGDVCGWDGGNGPHVDLLEELDRFDNALHAELDRKLAENNIHLP